MNAPESTLYGATLRGNEYGWKPEDFPRALGEASEIGLACLGGQFQFQLPDATCELYWLNADSAPRRSDEPWSAFVKRAATEIRASFETIVQKVDFLSQADNWEFLREKRLEGLNVLDKLWFVAYFVSESEHDKLVS